MDMPRRHRQISLVRLTVAPCATVLLLALVAPADAQDEAALRSFFEGRRATLKIDMPASAEGVDVRVDSNRPIDYQRYGDRLKTYGTSIKAGESSIVTLVKVKKDLIEFQLGGGGFGTFGDDSSTSVYLPSVEKSNREKQLEKRIKEETESDRKRRLQRELDDLRDERERENQRIEVQRIELQERRKERIAWQRMKGGSRFNLRYTDRVPVGITPQEVLAALAGYLDVMAVAPRAETNVIRAAPEPNGDAFLRRGMTRGDAERAFGNPVESSTRREGTLEVTTLVFVRGQQRITAEFVEDVLVRYTLTSR